MPLLLVDDLRWHQQETKRGGQFWYRFRPTTAPPAGLSRDAARAWADHRPGQYEFRFPSLERDGVQIPSVVTREQIDAFVGDPEDIVDALRAEVARAIGDLVAAGRPR